MNTPARLLKMILRGEADKFKSVLQEELADRASTLMEQLYRIESQNILNSVKSCVTEQPVKPVKQEPKQYQFFPENTYSLRDGNIGILTESERHLVAKLHENLNNDSKERLVKLLSETQESFNKVLKLAKTQNKR